MKQLIKKIKITTTIELLTGLHIGGSKESVEIGGLDNPVIKLASKEGQPYIPGSSLKGKMRCLLEQIAGAVKVGDDPEVVNLFGSADAKNPQPSKVIVRDAMLTEESLKFLKGCDDLDMPYTEVKWENVIDRIKGAAEHPRQTERVPAGVKFNVEMIVNVWDSDGDGTALLNLLQKAMNALENDYIGGSGTRGYGQIRFGEVKKQEINEATSRK